MLHEVKQDITTVTRGIVCHGVNCRRAMGSGVALAIKIKWPTVYETYMESGYGDTLLGTAVVIQVEPEVYVANCYTQIDFAGYLGHPDQEVLASAMAIESSLDYVFEIAQARELPLYLPRIGAGLGGLDWDHDVYPTIDLLSLRYPFVDATICIWP